MIGLIAFTVLTVTGRQPRLRGVKHNELFGLFLGSFLVWMMSPIERLLVGRVSANAITAVSLLLCALTGVAAATGHLTGACWMFAVAGILDVLDGRLARLNGQQTAAGALFDSVSDRWGELLALGGYIWFLKDSPWMFAALGALGASQMVSYTRARAESLGLDLRGGMMQRAERVVLISAGTLAAAWYGANPETFGAVVPILGGVLLICAIASTGTALNRWYVAYRELARRAEKPVVIEDTPAQPQMAFSVPAKLRESAELAPAAPRI
ncbi:MAG: CDP-alcohol phosphatidyltransferase family protein [Deltaproteobacteria bacterium]|nr:CDP-alcohol phosphatidyltransferase family protein [Deltaproteobacteria bacterium]